jgi:hypothetical protein
LNFKPTDREITNLASADQDQLAHPSPSDHGLQLFAIHSLHILKFCLKMINGFVQIEKRTGPF